MADVERSVFVVKKTMEDIALEVRDSVREVETSIKEIEATRTAVELAKKVLRDQEEKLSVGVGTTRDVLEAQRDLTEAATAQLRAVIDYNIALSALERAKGTILKTRGVEVKVGI